MVITWQDYIKKHISTKELKKLYKKEKCPKTKERLLAIKLYYDGKREKEIKEILGAPL